MKNFSQYSPWITGKILKKSGTTTSYVVELPDGQVIHHHVDQLKYNCTWSSNSIATGYWWTVVTASYWLTNLIKRWLNADTLPESGIHLYIFKLGAHWPQASTWLVSQNCFCVDVCVCVVCVCPTPRLLITNVMIWTQYNWLNKFYSCYMATVVVTVNGCGLGIDIHCGNYITQ